MNPSGWDLFLALMLIITLGSTFVLLLTAYLDGLKDENEIDQYGNLDEVIERWKNEGGK